MTASASSRSAGCRSTTTRVLFGPGSFRDSIVNTLILGAATATIVVPFTALCAWLVVRRVPGAVLLDHLVMLPLVFPAIILSVAFLNIFVNLPIALYGTLHFGHHRVLGALSGLWHALRLCRRTADPARSGRAGIDVGRVAGGICSGASCVPLLAPTLLNSWLLVFLLSVQAVALPLLLVGPAPR